MQTARGHAQRIVRRFYLLGAYLTVSAGWEVIGFYRLCDMMSDSEVDPFYCVAYRDLMLICFFSDTKIVPSTGHYFSGNSAE